MKFDLKSVPKARNLDRIGWSNGYVLVQFKGRPDRYVFGPAIPDTEVEKVLRNPWPDALFYKVIQKKYKCHKLSDIMGVSGASNTGKA